MRSRRALVHYQGVRSDPLRPLLVRFRRDGDAAAMDALVAHTRSRLLAVARRIGARQDAPDTVQAAYHALLARPEAPDAPILPWLMTTVVRIAYRNKAVALRQSRIADRLARPKPETPADRAVRAEATDLVRGEVAKLPERYRNPIVLYHLEGLSIAETARLLEIPASTVTTRLQRGRAMLRSRLGQLLFGALMIVPWMLTDWTKAPFVLGGIMEAKTVVLMAGVGLVTGTMGAAIGSTVSGSAPDRVRAGRSIHRVAKLEADLARRDGEIAALQRRLRERKTTTPAADRSSVASALVSPVKTSLMFGKKVVLDIEVARDSARRLGVTEEELQVAVSAYRALRTGSDPKVRNQAIDELLGLGERRTMAVAALFRGVADGTPGGAEVSLLVGHAFVAGQERYLIDVLRDDVTPAWTKGAILRNLGEADTPAIRDYLVERMAAEEDRYLFSNIAWAVGKLKEQRAVPHLAAKLKDNEDWIPFRPYVLLALGKIGGPAAEAAVLEHLRSAKTSALEYTFIALSRINPPLARSEAAAILAGSRANRLTEKEKQILQKHAGG